MLIELNAQYDRDEAFLSLLSLQRFFA